MKIGVMTLRLHTNYGGNLQAYALMRVLRSLGHEPWLIARGKSSGPWYRWLKTSVKRIVFWRKEAQKARALELYECHAREFVKNHIYPRTETIQSTSHLRRYVINNGFDAIVVGSDQVWRPQYSPCLEDYFLKFLVHNCSVRKVAYAASFGMEEWQLSPLQTIACGTALKEFDAVSVREDTAVTQCRMHFSVEARQVLDPTLLVSAEDYLATFKSKSEAESGGVFVYLLDIDEQKLDTLASICIAKNMKSFDLGGAFQGRSLSSLSTAPEVGDWINSFDRAEFVFTDSFHGCVFSILFNKPFIAFGNLNRGLARFSSMLELFGLSDRLTTQPLSVDAVCITKDVNWNLVNEILERERCNSFQFLESALNGNPSS